MLSPRKHLKDFHDTYKIEIEIAIFATKVIFIVLSFVFISLSIKALIIFGG